MNIPKLLISAGILLLTFLMMLALGAGGNGVPPTEWEKTFGGENDEGAYAIAQTEDDGYIVVGYTKSFGKGNQNAYVLKLDTKGEKEWDETYGGLWEDAALSVQQTKDKGYVISGVHESFLAGGKLFYVLKLTKDGKKDWEKTFGAGKEELASSVFQTDDGGYVVAGFTTSMGAGGADILVVKTNSNGEKEWSRTFGGAKDDYANSIAQTNDGGYIIAGYTESKGKGQKDILVLKLNRDGTKTWSSTFGTRNDDVATSVRQTKDGGYVVGGFVQTKKRGKDIVILKLDTNGKKQWSNNYGGDYDDIVNCISETDDGGYIVAGQTFYSPYAYGDVYVLKLFSNGVGEWDKTFGGALSNAAMSVIQTRDHGYALAGFTMASGKGEGDVYVIKIAGEKQNVLNDAALFKK